MNFFGVGLPEMIIIFVVALLIFGPKKLPEISRQLAKAVKGVQEASKEFEAALKRESEALESEPAKAKLQKGKPLTEAVAEGYPDTTEAPETETIEATAAPSETSPEVAQDAEPSEVTETATATADPSPTPPDVDKESVTQA